MKKALIILLFFIVGCGGSVVSTNKCDCTCGPDGCICKCGDSCECADCKCHFCSNK